MTRNFTALSLKAPWNCVTIRLQKPRRRAEGSPQWTSAAGDAPEGSAVSAISAVRPVAGLENEWGCVRARHCPKSSRAAFGMQEAMARPWHSLATCPPPSVSGGSFLAKSLDWGWHWVGLSSLRCYSGSKAGVAGWQTRRTQNPLAGRACGFASLLQHHLESPPKKLRAALHEVGFFSLAQRTGV